VHVSAVGFEVDGQIFESSNPYFQTSSGFRAGTRGNPADAREIQSGDSIKVSIIDEDVSDAIARAAKQHFCSEEDILLSPKFVALVALESGRQFSSMSWRKRVWRRALQIKREMDGKPPVGGSDG
jgi:hypothetical protein